jgi:hypothetical protein
MSAAPIIFSDGNKGGVGKTVVSHAVIAYCIANNLPIRVIEADDQNPDISRIFKDAEKISLREKDGWMDLAKSVHGTEIPVLVNLPAQIGDPIAQFGARIIGGVAKRGGHQIVDLWTMGRGLDSVILFGKSRENMPEGTVHIAILNGFFGPKDKFVIWNESKTFAGFEAAGGNTILFPELDSRVSAVIERNKLSYNAALANVDGTLEIGELLELEDWFADVSKVLAKVRPVMGI